MKGFASDNISGVHPSIMAAIVRANTGHTRPYGDDAFTKQSQDAFKACFGDDINIYFMFNGTAANTLALAAMTRSYQSILCSDCSHINTDECGAPEKFTGSKLIALPSKGGKLCVETMMPTLSALGFEHHSQPAAISITQPTEYGEVYRPEEVKAITDFAHSHGLKVHMDGARLANAAAFLNLSLKEISRDLGVDVLSFGGTKNGAMFGEAVIFFDADLSESFQYIRKQGMQLGSKMRFIAVQFETLLTDDLWLKNARHSNEMARLLTDRIKNIPGIEICGPVETNAVFLKLPDSCISKLQEKVFFYVWNETLSQVRFMTSFDTTPEDVEEFSDLIRETLESS